MSTPQSPKPIIPTGAEPIAVRGDGKLDVPDHPIIPFIEGDGTGPDIWRASVRVLDAAVAKEFGGKKKIAWTEVYAGEKSKTLFDSWLPDETLEAFKTYLVGIKGPLTTPIGGGIRSLNVAIRQMLDLYVCLRPVRYFKGVPSPVKAAREGRHGDLPREHGGHLRRHRVGRRIARGQEGHRVPAERDGREEDPLPRDVRHRRQARVSRRLGAADPCRARLRDPAQAQEPDAGAQGQHHEVHRGRVPRLGLRAHQARVRRPRRRLGRLRRQAAGWSGAGERTRSRTSRCSRC
jgi:hypothetical protein